MGLLAGMGWIIFGICYILYKIGEEELDGGIMGGVLAILIPIVIFAATYGAGVLFTDIFGEIDGGIILSFTIIGILIVLGIIAHKNDSRMKKESERCKAEQEEIRKIRETLPEPTRSQMESFLYYIQTREEPSQQQQIYQDLLRDAESKEFVWPLDTTRFKDMQSAWVYYFKTESSNSVNTPFSRERVRIFGNQEIASQTFFDPSVDRSNELVSGYSTDLFTKLIARLPTKISSSWCNRPKFAKKVFKMIEDSVSLTEETLYPLMLESYNSSIGWMDSETDAVWATLYPKVVYVLAMTSMNVKQREEWLKVTDLRLACLPAVQTKHIMTNEEVFPILLNVYNKLLDTEFGSASPKYSFTLLWHGLNAVGKAAGKDVSFLNYPKYIVE